MVSRCRALSAAALLVVLNLVTFSHGIQYENYAEEDTKEYWMKEGQAALKKSLWQHTNLNRAKNVIVFIGDGMGVATVTAARIFKGQKGNKFGEETKLAFENFPHVSLIKTYNVDRQVPDSAGTATAIFSGVKVNSGTLGVTAKVKKDDCLESKGQKLDSMLTWAQEKGRSTGIVTTTRITHATPASLYCHSANRDWECDTAMPATAIASDCKDIARQLIEDDPGKNLNVILGGGRRSFLSSGKGARRNDSMDLIEDWKKMRAGTSYQYVSNWTELKAVDTRKTDYLFGLMSNDHMDYELDRERLGNDNPPLIDMTQKAIEILQKNEKGFFLHVEGGRIDHAHHDTNAKRALMDTLAFEKAIIKATEMTSPEDTLILVTADHSHVMTINGYAHRGHDILGMGDKSDVDNASYTTLMYTTGPGYLDNPLEMRRTLQDINTTADDYRQIAAVPTQYETHGGEDVALYAVGPHSHLFRGVQEQNYIAHAINYASCMGPSQYQCAPSSSRQLQGSVGFVTVSLFVLFTQYFPGKTVYYFPV